MFNVMLRIFQPFIQQLLYNLSVYPLYVLAVDWGRMVLTTPLKIEFGKAFYSIPYWLHTRLLITVHATGLSFTLLIINFRLYLILSIYRCRTLLNLTYLFQCPKCCGFVLSFWRREGQWTESTGHLVFLLIYKESSK